MIQGIRSRLLHLRPLARLAWLWLLAFPVAGTAGAWAQQPAGTGTVRGKVTDENGAPVAGAQIFLVTPAISTTTATGGTYSLTRVPPGSQTVHVRMLGFRPDSAIVDVAADGASAQDFSLRRDPLQLQTLVVTGTQTPRMNLDASVAVTTLSAQEVERAAPRSTTEMLRYVPGFTRVESSGGEVNQNISMRGILGVEYVMFMEDGMPVFPTMHTYFMNADNLFRFDENIERVEVVRGGASALFGSNTPGAIINYINKTGGDRFAGTMRATAGTKALARYDVNAGGPLGSDWRFNVGGFYRYDHGVRDPGYPGVRGGQLKANVTRRLSNGYIRASVKYIDDRNQFILPLPFTDPADPGYVSGFGNYGAFNTNEGLDLRVPTPAGDLTLPLDNGLKTQATWFTVDAALDLARGWNLQNTAQVMQNNQEHNALVPGTAQPAADYVAGLSDSLAPDGSAFQFVFTNHFDPAGNKLLFDTPNGLVAPAIEWHVSKPISAIQDQLQLRKSFGRHTLAMGAYFANYTQDNHWNFTDVLMDVRDNPRFLDLVITPPGGTPDSVTKNGFRHFLSTYANGSGQVSIVSGVLGGEVQLTDRLRADVGGRVEYDAYVQSSERVSTFDLDNNPFTQYDNEQFGNGSFRHFTRNITDWAGSLGLNYRMNDNVSLYASGSRGYKMPELDFLLNAAAQEQVNLAEAKQVQAIEGGVKTQMGRWALTLNGFFTKLKKITGQGLEVVNGVTTWVIRSSPDNQSYGAEVEAVVSPVEGLQLQGNATVLKAELAGGVDSLARFKGRRIAVAPTNLGNVTAIYSVPRSNLGLQFKADWHWVGARFSEDPVTRPETNPAILPFYNYFNFGVGFALPGAGTRLSVDLLNAFQSKGLEEGNPRLSSAGTTSIFLARPLLPRRLQVALTYDFGGAGTPAQP
ncbi:MAG TPA: TonB-dependent receptor [Gemmatimonadales bacterium]|jgi:outer membrane receptor protein involved in Fe transport|nr:TonB-dependent receptor [Gemmatimonadales bacterium]